MPNNRVAFICRYLPAARKTLRSIQSLLKKMNKFHGVSKLFDHLYSLLCWWRVGSLYRSWWTALPDSSAAATRILLGRNRIRASQSVTGVSLCRSLGLLHLKSVALEVYRVGHPVAKSYKYLCKWPCGYSSCESGSVLLKKLQVNRNKAVPSKSYPQKFIVRVSAAATFQQCSRFILILISSSAVWRALLWTNLKSETTEKKLNYHFENCQQIFLRENHQTDTWIVRFLTYSDFA